MKKNILLITFIFFILSSFVYAVPPFQTSSDTNNQLVILYPKVNYFKINSDILLHFHVLNSSGKMLNNTDVNCYVHVYNTTNKHIINSELINNATYINDKDLFINNSYVNVEGLYNINLWCNSTTEYGYLNEYFYITNSGRDLNNINEGYFFIGAIIGILGLIFLLFMIYTKLDVFNHTIFRTFILCFIIFLMIIIPRTIIFFTNINLSNDLLGYYLLFIRIFTIYLIGYFIWSIADYYKKTDMFKQWFNNNLKNKGGK